MGLLPAAFLGIDWQALLDGAAEVARPLVEQPESIARHPSFALACWASWPAIDAGTILAGMVSGLASTGLHQAFKQLVGED